MNHQLPNTTVHLIGNAHLDPVWLWRWQEGYAEIKATFRSALDWMNEFPDFVFTSACAGYYAWVEENNPDMFKEIQARVKEGRWAIAGGMWIQPDCNIPSGESFARHALYSQQYFQFRFGITAKTGYNVDTFGHNGNLPQLLKLSGMDSYVMMRPSAQEKPDLQEALFLWESPDGTQITTFRIPNAYGHLHKADQSPEVMDISTYKINNDPPEELKFKESMQLTKELGQPVMNFYGVGNHGGGPTVANLEMFGEYIARNNTNSHNPNNIGNSKQCETDSSTLCSTNSLNQYNVSHPYLECASKSDADNTLKFNSNNSTNPAPSTYIKMSSPDEYFQEVKSLKLDLRVVKGDLHHHASGCYSAHSQVKAKNRQSEQRLIAAEKMMTLAGMLTGENESFADYKKQLKKGWERVMFNHFHDIMGGCSIKEAYDDTLEWYGEALSLSANVLNASIQKMSWEIDTMPDGVEKAIKNKDWIFWEQNDKGAPLVVFNTHAWAVKAIIQINRSASGISDNEGNIQLIQNVRGSYMNGSYRWNSLFMADLPAFGYKLFWVYRDKKLEDENALEKNLNTTKKQAEKPSLNIYKEKCDNQSSLIMENNLLRVTLDEASGYISSLYNKDLNLEFIDTNAAIPIVIDTTHCDTWAHGVYAFRNEVGRFTVSELTIIESGPVRAKVRVKSVYHRSSLVQDFILYAEKQYVEVEVQLDWQEKHKMLKLSFQINAVNPIATHDIPYGHIIRETNGHEVPSQQWVDVSGNDRGMSLLNNGKYSFDVKENDLRMTIANSSLYADHFGERDGLGEFMDVGTQNFTYALVPHQGKWQEAGVVQFANELNSKPIAIMETYHKGKLPREMENIQISAGNVIATVLKRAEDEEGTILRCYEAAGVSTNVSICLVPMNRTWNAHFSHDEVKTFFIPDCMDAEILEVNFVETTISI